MGGAEGDKGLLADPDLELVGEDSTDPFTLDFFFLASFLVGSVVNSTGLPANDMPDNFSDILNPAMAWVSKSW